MLLLVLILALQSPADIFKAANADMDAGRYAEAAAKFEQVLKDDPSHIPSEFDLAVCYTKLGKSKEAEELYRKIIEHDSNIYEAHFNLGVLLRDLNNGTAADEEFVKAAALQPDNPYPLIYHAEFLEQQGDIDKAKEFYDRAIAAAPTADNAAQRAQTQFRLRLGTRYRKSGEFDKAIEVLESLGQSNVELALAYFGRKNFAKAAEVFRILLTTSPGNNDYLYMLGKCQMELKDYPLAVSMFQHVLKTKPDDLDALSSLASTYQLQQDWTRAAATIEAFVRLKPRDAYAYFMLATAYDRLQDTKRAVLNYNKFLELDDRSNDARSFQARERAKTLERRLKNP